MGKPNKRHHELCLRYKQEGRRERNKAERAKRNEVRIAKFAKRREAKGEVEKDYTPKDPETRGTNKQESLKYFAWSPRQDKMDEYSKRRSFSRKIKNQLDAEITAEKQEQMNKKKGKGKKNND